MQINTEALQEDLRKVALALIIAALAAALLKPEESNIWHVGLTVVMGMVVWALGLIEFKKDKRDAS